MAKFIGLLCVQADPALKQSEIILFDGFSRRAAVQAGITNFFGGA